MRAKRVLAVLLILAFAAGLCGCGGQEKSGDVNDREVLYRNAVEELNGYIAEYDALGDNAAASDYIAMAGKFDVAATVLNDLGDYAPTEKDQKASAVSMKSLYYKAACYMAAGDLSSDAAEKLNNYENAAAVAAGLGSFGLGATKKASKIAKQCSQKAAELYEAACDYSKATQYYDQAGMNDESVRCGYYLAKELYDSGKYIEAYEAYETIRSYVSEDGISVKELLKNDVHLLAARDEKYSVGSTVSFGRIGSEPISWIILSREGDSLLMVADRVLECKQYNKTWTPTNWEQSSVRLYLNSDLLNGFTAEEKGMLLTSMAGTEIGTEDKVFLFSKAEAEKYCAGHLQCGASDAALNLGVWTDGDGFAWWWLRDCIGDSAMLMRSNGRVEESGYFVNYGHAGIRPAVRITIAD